MAKVIIALIVLSSAIGLTYFALWRARAIGMVERLTVWLIFSVALALLPIAFNAVRVFLSGTSVSFSELLKNGELLIVAVAIGGDATGKLIASGQSRKILKLTAGGSCILLIITSSLLFAFISTASPNPSFDMVRVASFSAVMFLLTIVTSGSCVLLAEVK